MWRVVRVGRRSMIGNHVNINVFQGFESLTLRHALDGELAMPCYLQSLQQDRIPERGIKSVGMNLKSGVEKWVSRNRNLWTWSGSEGSSHKQSFLCDVRVPILS